MVSLLEGALKKQIAAGFKGQLCKLKLRVAGVGSLDANNDPVEGTAKIYDCEGIRESIDAAWAASAGIEQTDVRILILLGSLKSGAPLPTKGHQVYVGKPFFKWHEVRRVLDTDPAGASTRLLSFEIPAPE